MTGDRVCAVVRAACVEGAEWEVRHIEFLDPFRELEAGLKARCDAPGGGANGVAAAADVRQHEEPVPRVSAPDFPRTGGKRAGWYVRVVVLSTHSSWSYSRTLAEKAPKCIVLGEARIWFPFRG